MTDRDLKMTHEQNNVMYELRCVLPMGGESAYVMPKSVREKLLNEVRQYSEDEYVETELTVIFGITMFPDAKMLYAKKNESNADVLHIRVVRIEWAPTELDPMAYREVELANYVVEKTPGDIVVPYERLEGAVNDREQ